MEVTCESEFGYLQDRDCLVENKFYTASELLALALTVEDDPEEHVGFKGEGKVFLPGNVTIEKPESDTDKGDQGHQRLLERTDEQPDRKVRRISAPAQRNQNGGRRARLHKISGLSGKTERQDRSGDRAWKEPAGHFVLHQGRGHREFGEGIWLVQERMVHLGDHEPHLAGSVQRRIHQEVRPVPARPCCGRNRFHGRQPF